MSLRMKKNNTGERLVLIVLGILVSFCLLCSQTAIADMYGVDSPHNNTYGYGCDSCHYTRTDTIPAWALHVPQDIDDTVYNNLCWSCHNSGPIAPNAKTHSSLQTSDRHHSGNLCWCG